MSATSIEVGDEVLHRRRWSGLRGRVLGFDTIAGTPYAHVDWIGAPRDWSVRADLVRSFTEENTDDATS